MMLDRRSVVPSRWALVFLAACCVLSLVIGYRARAAQAAADTPPAATAPAQGTAAPAQADPNKSDKTDKADKNDKGDADKTAPAKGATPRPPPSKAEESATIQDDPTLVPDDKESADNNVTFPIDI